MKFCPQCHRPADEDGCPMESMPGFTCPEGVEEDANTLVLACAPCGWIRGVPAGEFVKGLKSHAELPPCRRDECQAKLVRAEATPLQQSIDQTVLAKAAPKPSHHKKPAPVEQPQDLGDVAKGEPKP